MRKVKLMLVATSLVFSVSASAVESKQGNGDGWVPPLISDIFTSIRGGGDGWIPPKKN